jgi:hypothetical protein
MELLSWTLLLAAAGIGITHAVLGPDHYLPFLMLARARGWTAARALAVTGLCGVAHVASSLFLAGLGVALGFGVASLESVEAGRGDLAAWGLVAFGAAYGLVKVGSMLLVTALGLAGLRRLPFGRLERWAHAMAGGVIAASGLAIIYLGL